MLRGINQSQLFYDNEDRQVFLDRIARYKEETGFSLYAFALMDNHVHLLVKTCDEAPSQAIKKLALSYSYWFNHKYDRSGYLFQGRYRSEPVETNEYLLTLIRYIHQNPLKVGKSMSQLTSYGYFTGERDGQGLIDTNFVLELFDLECDAAIKSFKQLVEQEANDEVSSFDEARRRHVGDAEAIKLIKRIGNVEHCQNICNLPKEQRDAVFANLGRRGCSVRQIARLTGANRGIVHKAWSSMKS
jgi:REP element-mobilizing transposase RayT